MPVGHTGKTVNVFCRTVLALLLLGMVGLNVANVGARHGLASSIPGADEILIFAMIWLVFVGAALVAAQDKHLRFPVLLDRFPNTVRHAIGIAIAAGSACLFGFTAFASWQVIVKLGRIGQTSMAAGIPMTVPHGAVLVCFTLMTLIAAIACCRLLLGKSTPGLRQ